jgi:glycerophosphoryl diester phosphodiesterase
VTHTRIAHRGFAAVAEENSLDAIRGALALGCEMVEIDVRRRADGGLVLHHDSGDRPGAPLLVDALDLIAATGMGVMVDLKEQGTSGDVADALELHAPQIKTVCSGLPAEARAVKARIPTVLAGRTWPNHNAQGLPVAESIVGWIQARLLISQLGKLLEGFDLLVAFHRVLTREAVSRCHASGHEVYAWTVDGSVLVDRLRALGVDGVISDDPSSLGLPVDSVGTRLSSTG